MYSDTFRFLQLASCVKLSSMLSDFVALCGSYTGSQGSAIRSFGLERLRLLPALLCVRCNTRAYHAYRHYIMLVGMDAASIKAMV